MAALTAGLAAALLEKLLAQRGRVRTFTHIRRRCLRLAHADAEAFAEVIRAIRSGRPARVRQALARATDIPREVAAHALRVERACRQAERLVSPRFRSDLECVRRLASAAAGAADGFIRANVAWLQDLAPARRVERRVRRRAAASR